MQMEAMLPMESLDRYDAQLLGWNSGNLHHIRGWKAIDGFGRPASVQLNSMYMLVHLFGVIYGRGLYSARLFFSKQHVHYYCRHELLLRAILESNPLAKYLESIIRELTGKKG